MGKKREQVKNINAIRKLTTVRTGNEISVRKRGTQRGLKNIIQNNNRTKKNEQKIKYKKTKLKKTIK